MLYCNECGSNGIVDKEAPSLRKHEGPLVPICWPNRCRHFSQVAFSDGREPKTCHWCKCDYSNTRELTNDEYIVATHKRLAALLD